MENKEIKLAYLAGALDGDGSFSLIKRTKGSSVGISPLYYPVIQFGGLHKELVDMFATEFGGSIFTRKAHINNDGKNRKTFFAWKTEKSNQCMPALESLIPYLIVKKQRATLLRDFITDNPFIRGSNRLTNDVLLRREKSYLKMKEFNENPSMHCDLNSRRQTSEDSLFWAYAAGLMDTDGSFSLKREIRKSKQYAPVILLTMVDCRAIYHIMNNFVGGKSIIIKAKTAKKGFCYRFSINSREAAINFLTRCLPYLSVKKNIAQKLLEFCQITKVTKGCKGVSTADIQIRDQYYFDLIELNNGVYKFPLIVLEPLTDNAEGNKEQAGQKPCSLNAVSEETSNEDAVL